MTAKISPLIGLPDFPRVDIDGGQIHPAETKSVDTQQVAPVGDVSLHLRRMTQPGGFAGAMGGGHPLMKVFPVKAALGLLVDGEIRQIIRVHEEVVFILVVRHAAADEVFMAGRDSVEVTSITNQRGSASHLIPQRRVHPMHRTTAEHDFMVATQEDRMVLGLQFHKVVECATAIGPAIDVVAEEYQGIIRRRLDDLDQSPHGFIATVDISEGNGSHDTQAS